MKAGRVRAWLVAAVIFLLGAATGGVAVGWAGLRAVRQSLRAPSSAPGPADRAAARIGADLADELDLSAAQAARVQQILDESATRLKAVRARAVVEAARELRASSARIVAELPPEKHADFYRVIARRYERLGLTPPEAP